MSKDEKNVTADTVEVLQQLHVGFYKFIKVGDTITGVVRSVRDQKFGRTGATINRYVVENENGRIAFNLGSVADQYLEGVDVIGKKLRFVFKGKKDITNGHTVNDFEIYEVK